MAEIGKLTIARMLRREAQSLDLLALTPALAFAALDGSSHNIYVQFATEITAGSLDTSAWDVTLAANGGAAGALTTTGSVAGADGLVSLTFSGTPFKVPLEEQQAIVLTYTPSGTNDLKDAAGRTVAGFTYSAILPRISDMRKAAFYLMAKQGSTPTAPAATYGQLWMQNGPSLFIQDSVDVFQMATQTYADTAVNAEATTRASADSTLTTNLGNVESDISDMLSGAAAFTGITMPTSTVAGLPAATVRRLMYVSNGRKNGEGAGAGTGVLCYADGTAWRRVSDDSTVVA